MLDRLEPRPGAKPARKRAGRGPGSTRGRYCGRGVKGQGTRSGGKSAKGAGFEGGQMTLARRLPKRGFSNHRFRSAVEIVNLGDLARFDAGSTVDVAALVASGLVRRGRPVKLLADGDAPAKLTVRVQRASASARQKLEAVGGSVELV